MKKIKISMCILAVLALFLTNLTNISAYQYWKTGVTNPINVTVYKLSSAANYSAFNYHTQWTSTGIRFAIPNGLSSNIVTGVVNQSNGTYGVTKYVSIGKFDIMYYKSFIYANISIQRETVVHEVGHALGLAHTQAGNETRSVMRAVGFNNKAYPLSDDINGIKAKYF